MMEIRGSQTQAIVYADYVDPASMSQLHELMNHVAFRDCKVRVMPDVHAGKGSVIGFTAELKDKVIPSVVGVDIGCGVRLDSVHRSAMSLEDFSRLDRVIRSRVPYGAGVRDVVSSFLRGGHPVATAAFGCLRPLIEDVCARTGQDVDRVILSIGSLGSGNHYCELGEGSDGGLYLSIHSGSRNFGLQVANHHQRIAVESVQDRYGVHRDLCWLEGAQAQEYLKDMDVAQRMAQLSRLVMYLEISDGMGWDTSGGLHVECIHNYIDLSHGYVRKGAISARDGERVVIPISMAEGVILGTGLGNPEWNYSAPHGAGRLLSRSKAKQELSMEEYQERMSGIWSSCVSTATLDESPMAYKGMAHILGSIGPTVSVDEVIRPVYNFKAS